MDARVYFQLTDSITDSTTAAELAAMRDVSARRPCSRERRALERLLQSRETALESASTEAVIESRCALGSDWPRATPEA